MLTAHMPEAITAIQRSVDRFFWIRQNLNACRGCRSVRQRFDLLVCYNVFSAYSHSFCLLFVVYRFDLVLWLFWLSFGHSCHSKV